MSIAESRQYDFEFDPVYADPSTEILRHTCLTSNDIPKFQHKFIKKHLQSSTSAEHNAMSYRIDPSTIDDRNIRTQKIIIEPFSRDAEAQTMYRESNCQTDPYSPDYDASQSASRDLDIFLLEKYKFNRIISIGAKDIHAIKEAKLKKQLYDNLPPFTTEENIALRKKLLEEQELKEWEAHESEIDEMRHLKLSILQEERARRDAHHESLKSNRLNAIRLAKAQESEINLDRFRKTLEREMRQIERKHDSDPLLHCKSTINLKSLKNTCKPILSNQRAETQNALLTNTLQRITSRNNQPKDEGNLLLINLSETMAYNDQLLLKPPRQLDSSVELTKQLIPPVSRVVKDRDTGTEIALNLRIISNQIILTCCMM